MNDVNLDRFLFEYDLTWMSFFQNGEGHTYTRYGGRDDRDPEYFLTKDSLMGVMRQVLRMHEENDIQTIGRYEPDLETVRTPLEIPTMPAMMAKRDNNCIHCHDVKVAQLKHLQNLGRLEKDMVFTYPSPGNLGIHLNPDHQNVVTRIDAGSPGETAGLRAGDIIATADGQRILTFGDFTRVLELAPEVGELPIVYRRELRIKQATLELPDGWRRSEDPAWRPSVEAVGPSGGFWGAKADEQQREGLGLTKDDLAVRVTFIWGQWTRQAGVKLDDIVVSLDGQTHDMDIRQLHAHLQLNRQYGDMIPLTVLRGGEPLELTMELPSEPAE